MTRCLTVITAVHSAAMPYLTQAAESLVEQEVPDGWTLEWLVQVDGDDEVPSDVLDLDVVSAGRNRPGGPGVTRTTALTRARGDVIRTLDADDMLTKGALARDLAVLGANPDCHWVTTGALDLHPDGTTTRWDKDDPDDGPIKAGWALDQWDRTGYLPVLPSTMSMRRQLLLALGGWMALGNSEDTGLLLPASAIADGYFISEPGLLYRKHADQTTAQPHHRDPEAAAARRNLIRERAAALRLVLDAG